MRLKKIQKNKNLSDGVKCMLCEMVSNDLTSHITRTHCSIDEYKKQFPDAPFRSAKYLTDQSKRISGDKNPAYQHGGKYSPFSNKFIHGKDPSIHQRAAKSRDANDNDNTKVEYYIKRGFSQQDAQYALSKRQSTFSLQKCIDKFGTKEGTKIWKNRQQRWISTLDKKTPEEKMIINQKKMNPDFCISQAEKELAATLLAKRFDVKTQQSLNDANWIYDMVVGNKIIEYHGDYWHCNPQKYDESYYHKRLKMSAKTKWELDNIKKQHAVSKGYEYLVVWESDYKQNPQKVIDECVCFLSK